MNRREFARRAVLAPVALALQECSLSQAAAVAPEPTAKPRRPKTAAEYNKHPPITEPQPFDAPLEFAPAHVPIPVKMFEPGEVELLTGPLVDARAWNCAYMMRLPNDRLLHNFRINAGLASNAEPLGGWEAPTSELRGHFVGHYLSAAALHYAATSDRVMKAKADDLVEGIAVCQKQLNRGGYVSAFPEELFDRLDRRVRVWAPFYTLHKIMAGLLDMHLYAESDQALAVLLPLATWVDDWTASKPEAHMQDILRTEFGGMSEVLYNLTTATSDARWAAVGDRFAKKEFLTPLALRRDELKGLHANTHMPQMVAAAKRYELSGDQRFQAAAEFFWETVVTSRSYASGGSANTESWLTNAGHTALEMQASSHHQECCCAYNMMKLTRHLYAWSADPRMMDYYERNLFNHRLGTIQPLTGLTSYFLSMSPGAWKTLCTEDQTFWCCTGSALEDFAKLEDTIYAHDEGGIYVNLFAASRLKWNRRQVRIEQRTEFPNNGRIEIEILESTATPWTLHLRIPGWAREAVIRINGCALEVSASPGSYAQLLRPWKRGDRVELMLPMRLYSEPLPDNPKLQAFLYGPLVLAGQFPKGELEFELEHNQGPEIQEAPRLHVSSLRAKGQQLEEWIKPVPGKVLHFRTVGQQQDVTLKPLNASWDRFAVYWEVG